MWRGTLPTQRTVGSSWRRFWQTTQPSKMLVGRLCLTTGFKSLIEHWKQSISWFNIWCTAGQKLKYFLKRSHNQGAKVVATRDLTSGSVLSGLRCFRARLSRKELKRLKARQNLLDFPVTNDRLESSFYVCLCLFTKGAVVGNSEICEQRWPTQCSLRSEWRRGVLASCGKTKTTFYQNASNIISCQAIKDIKKGEEIGVPNKQDLSSDLSRTDRWGLSLFPTPVISV